MRHFPVIREHDLFSNFLPLAQKVLGHALAFKAEALLVLALTQMADPQTVKWARDVVRAQLGEIAGGGVPEDCVDCIHASIQAEARKVIG